MKIMIIDSAGMVGHVVSCYFKEQGHTVIGYGEASFEKCSECIIGSLSDTFMIRNEILLGKFDAVINCSAIINQDAENDKSKAVFINSYLPHFLETITEHSNTIIVHRSTDCIFSGMRGKYTLQDLPDATSFYARTKAVGEIQNGKDITIRTSLIGPECKSDGKGLFNWFYNQTVSLNGYANTIWTGLTTIEFARQVENLLKKKAHGVFQLVPNSAISKFELLCLFEKKFPRNRKITKVENERMDKSLIPETNGYKITIPSYEEMISEMALWIHNHREIYTNYKEY